MKRHNFIGRKQGRQERALNKLIKKIESEERDGKPRPALLQERSVLRFKLFGEQANG